MRVRMRNVCLNSETETTIDPISRELFRVKWLQESLEPTWDTAWDGL